MSNSLPPEQKDNVRRRLNFDEEKPTVAAAAKDKFAVGTIENPDGIENLRENPSNPDQNEINIIDLTNMTQQQKFEQMMKWNFDFINEVPLNGDWEWKRVEPVRSIDHKEKVSALGKEEISDDRNV